MEFIFEKGTKYRHFKGDIIAVYCLAEHSENGDSLVIYEHKGKMWARPKEMFMSEVEHDKYPDVQQKYRFELVTE